MSAFDNQPKHLAVFLRDNSAGDEILGALDALVRIPCASYGMPTYYDTLKAAEQNLCPLPDTYVGLCGSIPRARVLAGLTNTTANTKEELPAELIGLSLYLRTPPSQRKMGEFSKKNYTVSVQPYVRSGSYFESWDQALEEAGLSNHSPNKKSTLEILDVSLHLAEQSRVKEHFG